MEGIKSVIESLVLVGLFVLAIAVFAIKIADINNAGVSLEDDPTISSFKNNISETLGTFNTDVNDSQTSFSQSTPEAGADSILILSVASIWKTLVRAPKLIYNLTAGMIFDKIFGDSGFYIFFTTIGVLLAATILFYAWRWIKSGEP